MKVKMSGKIKSLIRNDLSGLVSIHLDVSGKVQDDKLVSGKEATFDGTLSIKPVIAEKLSLGSTITILISDEDISIT